MLVPRIAAQTLLCTIYQRTVAPRVVIVTCQNIFILGCYSAEAAQVVGMHITERPCATHLLGYGYLAVGQVNVVNFFGYITNWHLFFVTSYVLPSLMLVSRFRLSHPKYSLRLLVEKTGTVDFRRLQWPAWFVRQSDLLHR